MRLDIVIAPVIDYKGLHYMAYSRIERNRLFRAISFEYKEISLWSRAEGGRVFHKIDDIQKALIKEYGTRVNIVKWEGIR
jgi:hypothetical protein